MPMAVNRLVFIIILLFAFLTKQDYVLLVWFFVINDAPGRIFSARGLDDVRIPIYTIVPGISLSFQDLFILLYIIKVIFNSKKINFIFKKEFILFFSIGGIYIIYSLILGMNSDSMIYQYRSLISWSFIFIIPYYVNNKERLVSVSRFLMPIVLLSFAAQLFSYITGNYFDNFLRGVEYNQLLVDESKAVSRSYSSLYILLISTLLALYFLFTRKSYFSNNYLGVIIFIAAFSIFLTATRGYILALSFLMLSATYLFGFSRKINKIFRVAAVSTVILLSVLVQYPAIQMQASGSFNRLLTLEGLIEGDLTAKGTLKRLDVRGPRVMAKFWESPIIGFGFSNEYVSYEDGHVAHQNLLLSVGILGYFYLNLLFLHFCLKTYRLARISEIRRAEGKAPLIFVFGLLSVFIIHSSSTQFWGYSMGFDPLQKSLFFGFLFAGINIVLGNSDSYHTFSRPFNLHQKISKLS